MGCNGRQGVKASPINLANKRLVEEWERKTKAQGQRHREARTKGTLCDWQHNEKYSGGITRRRGDSHKRWNQQHTKTTCISYKKPQYASNQSLSRTVSHNAKLLRDDVYEEWMLGEKAPAMWRLQSGDTKKKPADLFSSSQDSSRRLMFISVNVVIIQMNQLSPSQGDMLLWAVLAASC